jgi:hypothetical protein
MPKNQLLATATQVSTFWLMASIPRYVAFVFGLVRDLWNPSGRRDRGFFLLFAPMTAITFIWMTLSRLSYQGRLLFSVLLAMLSFQFIVAGQLGLISLLGQEKLMSGLHSSLPRSAKGGGSPQIPLTTAGHQEGSSQTADLELESQKEHSEIKTSNQSGNLYLPRSSAPLGQSHKPRSKVS